MSRVAAIDLGATSGRVLVGAVESRRLHVEHVARFPNGPVRLADGLHWDLTGLWHAAATGLGRASRAADDLVGVAVDSWAVDYGLLRGTRLLGEPYHYRDARNAAAVAAVHRAWSPAELYARNGLQHLPFNTLFQLVAAAAVGELDTADRLLLVPDLIGFWLTGTQVAERTNASTTGLLAVGTDRWDARLVAGLGLRQDLLPEVVEPGTVLGLVQPAIRAEYGIAERVQVSTVGSHDTASAVVGVPLTGDDAAYLSCGTWSLLGVELPAPVATEDARLAGFTNESGVDGRTRFLKNVMGLWLLSESIAAWSREGDDWEIGALLARASDVPGGVPRFDANDPRLLAPGDMPARVGQLVVERGGRPPEDAPTLVRCVLESLAAAYADTVRDAERLTGRHIRRLHVVGGGAQNALLCQLTADETGIPVIAGPVEATAIGNLLVQARTHGLLTGDLEALRAVVSASHPLQRYEPRPATSQEGPS